MRGVKIEQVIGERIRELREGLGISQAELGNRLPLPWPRQAVSAAEKGRPRSVSALQTS
jgi:transcriptional regulator with XRE-family HTH domain